MLARCVLGVFHVCRRFLFESWFMMVAIRPQSRPFSSTVEPDRFDIYESAMNELGTPSRLSPDDFADLYLMVTERYDEYRDGCDGLERLRDWAESEFPGLPELLEVGLSVERVDIRGLIWLCEQLGYDYEMVRTSLAGKSESFAYQRLVTVDDWRELQEWFRAQDWVVLYRDVRRWMKAPHTGFHGRAVANLCDKFGVTVVKHDGSEVARYRPGISARYERIV